MTMATCGRCKMQGATVEHVRHCYSQARAPRAQTQTAVIEPPASRRELEDGVYLIGDMETGTVAKVLHAVGTGNQYAKGLDRETGKFGYVPGLITAVRKAGRRMTLEDAKQFGALYGVCCACGRTLSNEKSIERALGPICAQRFV